MVFYYRFNPANSEIPFPPCPSRAILGVYCPGCGSQRAFHQILHGHWADAMKFNPVMVLMLPLAAVLVVKWILFYFFGILWRVRLLENNAFLYALLCLFILYMILRNVHIPELDWLRPPE